MRLAIMGTGYVGLVSGACFSDLGHDVICADINEQKILALQQGKIPIYEPGLDEMVRRNVEQGRLSFTTNIKKAIQDSLMIFVAVGTPPREDGTADLQYVFSVAENVGKHINGYKVIIDKSTVPVGTAARVRETVQAAMTARGAHHEFDVVSNPEFLKEGAALEDFMKPDRVVIGCDNVRVRILMEELYSFFARNGRPIIVMSTESAEMTKYAANAMLATKISFINEIAAICERVGANIDDVRQGIGSDRRIGYEFISPGIGYGGSCFPKDVKALIQTAQEAGVQPRVLPAVDALNEQQKSALIEKMRTYYHDDFAGRTFALWGLAFKPETDDVREAPALAMAAYLLKAGARLRAYDPKAAEPAAILLGHDAHIEYVDHYYDAAKGCDALVLATEWSFFRNTDLARLKQEMKTPVVFDGRNVYAPALMSTFGFDYFSIGRAPVLAFSQASGAATSPG
ncbi:MAG: UDP-glucose/GDP-mannose dehydrogenase family protein [Candidatus Hydrogenedentes bacterium]|nr:UDP-glucose/GDP-mannose dehydrogenase family protein [Candidatus Hydrogenedentota bacterium]MBI3119771.1 UDP-glucose/GDP-mannose dehydrogenase family protein [Candidatus Hydrogenedentota bacterium]